MNTPLPQGFSLAVASAGFKTPGRPDLALAVSHNSALAAGVFTTNVFKAAPVVVGQRVLQKQGTARAILINTGQANACTGDEGLANCRLTQELVAGAAGMSADEVLPASTGVIGAQLKMEAFRNTVPYLIDGLGQAGVRQFAEAIMTTDSFPKYAAEKLNFKDGEVVLTGMAKGAGMICPNMATMLSVILCDADVEKKDWDAMFARCVEKTFNRVTVDGDTSTNDTIYGLANGASGVKVRYSDLSILEDALTRILHALAYKLVQDGEGATKVIHIRVSGARNDADAELAARTIGHSQLVKTAMYGKDANWGRIVAAIGRCGASFEPSEVTVSLCGLTLFQNEQPTPANFDAALAGPLQERDLDMDISLGSGPGSYELLASDLTHEYVSVNADYRS